MIHEASLDPSAKEYGCGVRCISWSAIFVGALVGIGLTFLLQLFSVAIGANVFTASTTGGALTLAAGGFASMVLSIIVAMFSAGWVSGFLARNTALNEYIGVLYGFATWCVALILSAWLSIHIGHLVTANYRALSHPEISISKNAEEYNETQTNQTNINSEAGARNEVKRGAEAKRDAAQESRNTAAISAQAQNAAPTLGFAFFIIFLLFFIGALASCFGGYFGLTSRCGDKRPTV